MEGGAGGCGLSSPPSDAVTRARRTASEINEGDAGVTGQEFSSKINDEVQQFACNNGL